MNSTMCWCVFLRLIPLLSVNDTDVLKLYVKTINPTNETNNPNNWIDKDWSEIAQYNISKVNSFNWTGLPSIATKIFRK